jgi:hypothetical protein
MGESNNSVMMMMSSMMSMFGCLSFTAIAIGVLIWMYNKYWKDDDGDDGDESDLSPTTGTGETHLFSDDNPGQEYTLPTGALEDTSEDCVYMYESGAQPGWRHEGSVLVNSGQWCLSDKRINERINVDDLKKKRHSDDTNKSMINKLDYIRLGKNLNMTVYKDVNDTEGKKFFGGKYGNKNILDLDYHDGWVNDIEYFKIEPAN